MYLRWQPETAVLRGELHHSWQGSKATSLTPPYKRMLYMWQTKSKHQGAKVKKLSCCRQGKKKQFIFLRSVNKNAFTPSLLSKKQDVNVSVDVKIFPETGILSIFSLIKLIIYISAVFLKINKSPVSLTQPKFHTSFSILMSLRFSRTCLTYKRYNF